MPSSLHFIPRAQALSFPERARMLATLGDPDDLDAWVRVVEMFTPGTDTDVADLAFDEFCTPEVITLMHEAGEIHIHGLDLKLALFMMPFVKPEKLEKTPLIIHGPVANSENQRKPDATRFQVWPGPVYFDDRVDASAIPPEYVDAARVSAPVWLDPEDPLLLPRLQAGVPLRMIDDLIEKENPSWHVTVLVSHHVPHAIFEEIDSDLKSRNLPIELIHASAQQTVRNRAMQRLAQAGVVLGTTDPLTEEFGLQEIPTIAMVWSSAKSAASETLENVVLATGESAQEAAMEAAEQLAIWYEASWKNGERCQPRAPEVRQQVVARCYCETLYAKRPSNPIASTSSASVGAA